MGLQANIHVWLSHGTISIAEAAELGGQWGHVLPHYFIQGGDAPTKFGQLTATIRRNVHTPPPVCSIIIHVDMVFRGEETG